MLAMLSHATPPRLVKEPVAESSAPFIVMYL